MSFVAAATGLLAEARIVAAPGVRAVSCGGRADMLAEKLRCAIADGASAILSFGIAGGLHPELNPGDIVVASAVVTPDGRVLEANPVWRETIAAALAPAVRVGRLAGVAVAVASIHGKSALHTRTDALAADMESHVAAQIATDHGLPFAALRAVADPAARALPAAALVGLRADGSSDVAAVLRELARSPAELPALIRVALDTRAALRALAHCQRLASAQLAQA